MTRMTIAGLAVVATCAVLLGSAAHSVTTRTTVPPVRQVAAPAVTIDVFELMGKALGELPVEAADTH